MILDYSRNILISNNLNFVGYHDRMSKNAAMQKEWVKEQTREHNWDADNNAQEASDYAAQTAGITAMRGMLEDEATRKKNNMMKEM